jgi:adenine deaminase
MAVSLGDEPADMVIKDGTLMEVYTGRMLLRRSVAVWDKWIAFVGPDATHTIGKHTQVIQANGRVVCPGYVDSHTHLCNYYDIADFLPYAVPGGTTTYVTEVESFGFVLGAEGFRAFLDQVDNRPVKFYCLIPPLVTLSKAAESYQISREEARELLKDPRVIGLGETYWQAAIMNPDDRVLELMQETLRAGKSVQGHAAGASDKRLAAYAVAGAMSCHESISTQDILSRLELGYYTMVREGDIRRDLEIILPLKDEINLRRLILVTDGVNPSLLLEEGYLVDVVQKAVDLGFEPIQSVQMVTLNPAEHFGLDHLIGGIAPGRCADILLLPELGVMRPEMVISNGRVVAENGEVTVSIRRMPHPKRLLETVNIGTISSLDLALPLPEAQPGSDIRTIDIQPGGLVTREGRSEARVSNGHYVSDPGRDLLKIVFIERVSGCGEKFIGFVRGWGQREGAVATTLGWEALGITAIGANDDDLSVAINSVIRNQGGMSLSLNGELLVDIPCRVGGYISQMRIEELGAKLDDFKKTIKPLGSNLDFPLLTLCIMTSAAIPFIRITEKGYFRFRESDLVGI